MKISPYEKLHTQEKLRLYFPSSYTSSILLSVCIPQSGRLLGSYIPLAEISPQPLYLFSLNSHCNPHLLVGCLLSWTFRICWNSIYPAVPFTLIALSACRDQRPLWEVNLPRSASERQNSLNLVYEDAEPSIQLSLTSVLGVKR